MCCSVVHAKNLAWSVRIISLPEFEILQGQAMDCLREKRRFEQQRYCLRRSIVAHAQKLSGVVHGSTVEAQYAEEDYKRNKSMLKEVTKLSEQNQVLLADLEKAEIKIEDLETHRQALVESKHLLSASWTFSNSQLAALEEQLKQLQLMIEDMNLELEEKDHITESLHSELESSRDKVEQICHTIDSVVQSVEPKLKMDFKAYEELKLRFDIRSNRLAQYVREGRFSDEGESLCKDILNDGKQTLSVLQVGQQLLSQVKDIMSKIVIEGQEELQEEEEVKAVTDLSDF
ncbi:hypothetical protein EON65_34300 [archaeon]|nr:MAG: hypothetical protein EON65_34300 [archaeon]